jgi:hypothetical protein
LNVGLTIDASRDCRPWKHKEKNSVAADRQKAAGWMSRKKLVSMLALRAFDREAKCVEYL